MSTLVRVSSLSHDRLKNIAQKEGTSMSLLLDIAIYNLAKVDLNKKALEGSRIEAIANTTCNNSELTNVATKKDIQGLDGLSERLSKILIKHTN